MNVSVIIPVHVCDDTITPMLAKAIDSIVLQEKTDDMPKIYIVYAAAIEECIKGFVDSQIRKHEKLTFESFELVKNEEKTDFQSQINLGATKVETDYFSILEFDDEYSTTYFYNVGRYLKTYPDIDFFLTMLVEVNEKDEGLKLTNEVVWAQQFVGENGEMGYLNQNALKQNTDFKICGSVMKKDEFLSLNGLKSNIKLTFQYEFLLRALNNACKIYSIPKIGYKHLATREGSLFDHYLKEMPIEERKFWFDTATNEANFINDRVIDLTRLQKIVVEEAKK